MKTKNRNTRTIIDEMTARTRAACKVADTDFNALDAVNQRIAFEYLATYVRNMQKDLLKLRRTAETNERDTQRMNKQAPPNFAEIYATRIILAYLIELSCKPDVFSFEVSPPSANDIRRAADFLVKNLECAGTREIHSNLIIRAAAGHGNILPYGIVYPACRAAMLEHREKQYHGTNRSNSDPILFPKWAEPSHKNPLFNAMQLAARELLVKSGDLA